MADELVVTTDAGVRTLTLNRPESRNGLTLALNERLIAALAETARDAGVRCVILTGAGGSFCSGVDLRASAGIPGGLDGVIAAMGTHFHPIVRGLRALPMPSIAAVDGAAVGFGCDLALACDLRIASERARFGEIFVRRGLMPDGGGTFHLPRLVGLGRALELMFTGDAIDAGEALRIGLVNRVVPAAELDAEARKLAARVASNAPIALRNAKALTYRALAGDLDHALAGEVQGQAECLRSKDFLEGVSAFFQKREPLFKGE